MTSTTNAAPRRLSAIALLLFLSMLLSIFVGCAQPPETPLGEPPPGETPLHIKDTAKSLIQAEALGEAYTVAVDITEDSAYLANVPYDKITKAPELSIVYSASLLHKSCDDLSVLVTMERLKTQPALYLLETDREAPYGKRVALYDMDGTYYLLTLDEQNEVLAIHTIPADAATQPLSVDMIAQIYAQYSTFSSYFPLRVKIEGTALSVNTYAYTITYVNDFVPNPDIFLQNADKMTAVQQVLRQVQAARGCYLLECSLDDVTDKIAVYDIDGIYYFLNVTASGEVLRLHYATPWSGMAKPQASVRTYPYATQPTLFWSSLTVKEADGHVYFDDYLYETVTATSTFEVLYDEDMSWGSDSAGYKEKIQNADTFYLCETSCTTTRFGQRIVACQADSIWFFLMLSEDGKVIEIYHQR